MSRILYYLFLKPLSLLPLSVLYVFSDFIAFTVFRLIGYRRKVVMTNLRNSFPERPEAELKGMARTFYRFFCDQMIETLRLFSMPAEELKRRCLIVNQDLFQRLADEGRSVIITAGHHNNWEMAAMSVGFSIPHQSSAIFHPLKDAFLNQKLYDSRSRFGLTLVSTKAVKEYFSQNRELIAVLFATDQAPSNPYNAYWTTFLNQDTPVFWGTEIFAKRNNLAVVYGKISRLSRGHYVMSFELITDNAKDEPRGAITEKHTRALERAILEAPEYWLWSHRRWKRQRPADLIANN